MFFGVLIPPAPEQILARIAERSAGDLEATVVAGGRRFLVGRRGGSLTLRIAFPGASPLATVRTYRAEAGRAFLYDDLLNEMVPSRGGAASTFERLATVVGVPDPSVGVLLDPVARGGTFNFLRQKAGWAAKPGVLTSRASGEATTVSYDPKTFRLLRLTRRAAGRSFDARYVYAENGLNRWQPPSDRRAVAFLTDLSGKFLVGDAAARAALSRMIRRNARLAAVKVRIAGDSAATVESDGSSFRQAGSRLESVYAGGILTVRDLRTKRLFRGAVRAKDVRAITGRLGEGIVPLGQALLGRRLPFLNLFAPPRRVKVKGSLVLAGTRCLIVDLLAPGFRTTLFLDPSGRVVSLEAETRDRSGAVTLLRRQRFAYSAAAPIRPPAGPASALPK